MTKTEHYDLNQWDAGDCVLREDFNKDNRKIDEALAAIAADIPKIAAGTYTGNGTYGSDNLSSLSFPFKPNLVFVTDPTSQNFKIALFPGTGANVYPISSGYAVVATWTGNTLFWYSYRNAEEQYNTANKTYYYLAV